MKRYGIFKGTGGLCHMLTTLNRVVSLCEEENRDLIIDTENQVSFKHAFSKFFTITGLKIKYYDNYDVLDKNLLICGQPLMLIKNNYLKYTDQKYQLLDICIEEYHTSSNDVVVFGGYLVGKTKHNITVNNDIVKLLEKEELIKTPYISIHFRNTDKKNDIEPFIKKFRDIHDKTGINTLYLASDYFEAYGIFSNAFPQINIIRKTIPPAGIYNLHYCSSINKFDEIYQSIRDIFYVTHSDYFIPSYNSGFSTLIIDQINNNYPLIPNIKSKTVIL
jgi:hypothetical protein